MTHLACIVTICFSFMDAVSLLEDLLRVLTIPREHFWLVALAVLTVLHRLGEDDSGDDAMVALFTTDRSVRSPEIGAAVAAISLHASRLFEEAFFHLAFTPIECTIMCSEWIVEDYFTRALEVLKSVARPVGLGIGSAPLPREFPELYLAFSVDTDGDAQRVLDLTAPLSAQNIPIFFIPTHDSSLVLFPEGSKAEVVEVLRGNGFQVDGRSAVPDSPVSSSPTTSRLSSSTFLLFARHGITPRLLLSKLYLARPRPGATAEVLRRVAEAIAIGDPSLPGQFALYFAITHPGTGPVSVLVPKHQPPRWQLTADVLQGSADDAFVLLAIDLRQLPMDTKGIIAGVALRLLEKVDRSAGVFEMVYMSMGLSAVVLVAEEWAEVVGRL